MHPQGLPDEPRAGDTPPTPTTTPFGIWFANPDTLYVADEGAGDNTYSTTTNGTYTAAAASTTAGLQKWVFDPSTGSGTLPTPCSRASTSASPTRCPATRPG